jgi:tetratricopeptide (TPR) repeat protein
LAQVVPEGMTAEDRTVEAFMLAGKAMHELNNYYRTKDLSERPALKNKILYLFNLAIQFDSLHPNIYHYRSFAYRAFGRADSSLMDLNRYEQIVLSDSKWRLAFDVNSFRAFLLANLGKIHQAIDELSISLKKRPLDSADNYYRSAWLNLLLADTATAFRQFGLSVKSDSRYYQEKYMGQTRFVNLQGLDTIKIFLIDSKGKKQAQRKVLENIAPSNEFKFVTLNQGSFSAACLSSESEFELSHQFFFKFKAKQFKINRSLGPGLLLYAAQDGWQIAISFQKDTLGKAPSFWPQTKAEAKFCNKNSFFAPKPKKAQLIEKFVPLYDAGYFRLTLKMPANRSLDPKKVWERFSVEVPSEALEY